MKKSNFDAERELSFKIPVQDLLKLFVDGILIKTDSMRITQKWCIRGVTNGVPYSNRIRKVYDNKGVFRYAEHTMKYYLSHNERLEFNSRITEEEYERIFGLHPHGKVVNKTRLLFIEKAVECVTRQPGFMRFNADIIDGSKDAIIEIEFRSKEDAKRFQVPSWLQPYIGGK